MGIDRSIDITEFESSDDYWKFDQFIKNKSRFVLDNQQRRFLEVVLATSQKRTTKMPGGYPLWRAHLDDSSSRSDPTGQFEIAEPAAAKFLTPSKDRASEGRVNPKGIPCLYLATEKDTAMTEVRPWIGSDLTVAQFKVVRDLKLVDCRGDLDPPKIYFCRKTEEDAEERERNVWFHINQAFSTPVTRTDDVADYAPTQVLAEAFKSNGFDGMAYGSMLGKGKGINIALFDLSAAEIVTTQLYHVEEVIPKFSTGSEEHYHSEESHISVKVLLNPRIAEFIKSKLKDGTYSEAVLLAALQRSEHDKANSAIETEPLSGKLV